MAVPTDRDFSTALELAAMPIHIDLSGFDGEGGAVDVRLVRDHLAALDDARAARWEDLRALPAVMWLVESREYKRALSILHGRRRAKPTATSQADPDFHQRQAQRIVDRRIELVPAEAKRSIVRELAGRYSHGLSSYWVVAVLKALHEYFYSLETQFLAQATRELAEAASEAERAIQKYIKIAQRVDLLDLSPYAWPGETYRRARLGERLPVVDPELAPIRRNDEYTRERLLVYRLWRAHTVNFGTAKAEVIASLMGVEGVQHQYDTRSIEKICKGFSVSRKASKQKQLPGQ